MLLRLKFADGEIKDIFENVELSINSGFMVLNYDSGDVILYPAHVIEEALIIPIKDTEVLEPDEIVIGIDD